MSDKVPPRGVNPIVLVLGLMQLCFAARVMARLWRTRHGETIGPATEPADGGEQVTVLLPVLNEEARLAPALEGLIAQGEEVRAILVIDGGSSDGTRGVVERFAARDRRIEWLVAPDPPPGANGKAWQLAYGAERCRDESPWLLTIDADVRPAPLLVRSLMRHAERTGVGALSVATRQRISGTGLGVLHPAMLTTLVYRFGIPGRATTDVSMVQANGQCFLVQRDLLAAAGGFSALLGTLTEDVTLARRIAGVGEPVGFYEAGDLAVVDMYASAGDAWANWPRSLPMRDAMTRWSSLAGLAEVLLVQAAPLPLSMLFAVRFGRRHPLTSLNLGLVCARVGVLAGTGRAYEDRRWSYWVSPLVDLPVALRLWQNAFRSKHTWRGRPITRKEL